MTRRSTTLDNNSIETRRGRCRSCAKVKQEKLAWLSDNPFYTRRFAFFVGRRCRTSTIQDVAREVHLDWKTVKDLDQQYMQEQLRRAGTPAPRTIGIDEVSIRKGHTYRIVVSDLERRRPIWFGGQDRSEASLDLFYQWLGAGKNQRVRLAVMDMWKAFRNSTVRHAPHASILFDKFPRDAPPWGGFGPGEEERVRPAARKGSQCHQGPEVHAPVTPREPHARRAPFPSQTPPSQPAAQRPAKRAAVPILGGD